MAKNWRLAVCTRSRIILALLSLFASWATIAFLWGFASSASQAYQESRLEQRIKRLKIGMTEEEMIRTMGRPSNVRPVTTERIEGERAGSHLRRFEYYSKWGPLKSGVYRPWVVIFDNEADKVIEISLGMGGLVEVDPPPEFGWIVGGTIIGLAVVFWFLILRWCKRGRETKPMKS